MIVGRDHSLDNTISSWLCTDGVLRFFVECLGISAPELSKQFDAWCVARINRECSYSLAGTVKQHLPTSTPVMLLGTKLDSVEAIQANCRKIIALGLGKSFQVKRRTDAHMKSNFQIASWEERACA